MQSTYAARPHRLCGPAHLDRCSLHAHFACRLSCVDAAGAVPEAVQLTLLPLQAWSAVQLSPEGQLHRAEAGVVLTQPGSEQQQDNSSSSSSSEDDSSQRVVSCRVYDASLGQLQTVSIAQEARE